MLRKKIKYTKANCGYLYSYPINENVFEQFITQNRVKYFADADYEWLNYILSNRAIKGVAHNYDIVIGPTADDDMKLILNNYREGFYGFVGSIEAMRTTLNLLNPEKFGTQMVINTELGLNVLRQDIRGEEVIHK